MKNFFTLLASIAIAQAAGLIGSFFTFAAIPAWYATLVKPSFSPPDWVFGPVWITLYTMMGIASFLIWKTNKQEQAKKGALRIYAVHLVANAAWTILFFGLRNPGLALIEILVLLFLIALVIERFYRINKTAAYLLIPYLLWVMFATKLNASIWFLNRPW